MFYAFAFPVILVSSVPDEGYSGNMRMLHALNLVSLFNLTFFLSAIFFE